MPGKKMPRPRANQYLDYSKTEPLKDAPGWNPATNEKTYKDLRNLEKVENDTRLKGKYPNELKRMRDTKAFQEVMKSQKLDARGRRRYPGTRYESLEEVIKRNTREALGPNRTTKQQKLIQGANKATRISDTMAEMRGKAQARLAQAGSISSTPPERRPFAGTQNAADRILGNRASKLASVIKADDAARKATKNPLSRLDKEIKKVEAAKKAPPKEPAASQKKGPTPSGSGQFPRPVAKRPSGGDMRGMFMGGGGTSKNK